MSCMDWMKRERSLFEIEFEPDTASPDFSALAKARKWLDEHGFVYGDTSRLHVCGIMLKSKFSGVAKWHNLTKQERRECHGILIFHRGGKAKIVLDQNETGRIQTDGTDGTDGTEKKANE